MKFNNKLVLNKYILSLFEVENLEELSANLKNESDEAIDENGVSLFYHRLTSTLFGNKNLPKEQLLLYDNNIVRHTKALNRDIRWKYFQYLTLLFTEIYLDMYFRSKEDLLKELNAYLKKFNSELPKKEQVEPFKYEELNKLAFWNATGSGKTLLMHMNMLQFNHYSKDELNINKTLLLTPNEGLSEQHLKEFEESNIEAEIFTKDSKGLFKSNCIEIIEITKLKEEHGDKTVAVESFEDNNLVFIDEGHRGSSGDEWKKNRDKLSVNGFAFEYSATFGQAINAGTGAKKTELTNEYSKAILFDYSYKYFYNDGHGKNYSILNLSDDKDETINKHYLIASLLSFYQQIKIFKENPQSLKMYNIENPLMVFVGASVNAVRTEKGKNVSDVINVLLFLDEFIKDSSQSKIVIDNILSGNSGITNKNREDIFDNKFSYLHSKEINVEAIYSDMLQSIFNASSGLLHLDDLKGCDGEIGLRLGDNDYFGVINVGDTTKLLSLCDDNGIATDKKDFSNSLFLNINDKKSKISILIGSKKFTEGWSSWRVSIMGLLNMGKKEGSQIIQLFGRGVRLKGKNFSLKRSNAVGHGLERKLQPVETLYIFGLKADYMKQFKEYLEEEGVPVDEMVEFTLPVIYDDAYKTKKLKVLRVKEGKDFKREQKLSLKYDNNQYIVKKVILNLYNQIDVMESVKGSGNKVDFDEAKLTHKHFAFLNHDNIYFEIQRYKSERNWFNLSIEKDVLKDFFNSSDWYKLLCPTSHVEIKKFDDYKKIEEIVIALLKLYVKAFYEFYKSDWEQEFLEFQYLSEDDANLISEYSVEVEDRETKLIEQLKLIESALKEHKELQIKDKSFKSIFFNKHIYNPLIFKAKGLATLKLKPVHLNEGEIDFIEDLEKFLDRFKEQLADKEIYLLRNQSKTGIGVFTEVNFYPDFMMWILDGDKQYITFIDPKGLVNLNTKDDPKINFSSKIKKIEEDIGDENTILNSFIVSVTEFQVIDWIQGGNKQDLENRNVLFQKDDKDIYIRTMFEKILG